MTKSLRIAPEDLGREPALIVHPGEATYAVHEKVDVVSLAEEIVVSTFVVSP